MLQLVYIETGQLWSMVPGYVFIFNVFYERNIKLYASRIYIYIYIYNCSIRNELNDYRLICVDFTQFNSDDINVMYSVRLYVNIIV